MKNNNKNYNLYETKYKNHDIMSKPLVSLIVLMVVIAIDTFSTYTIFKDAYANSAFVTWGLSFSTAFAINSLPFAMATLLKKRASKMEGGFVVKIILAFISYVLIMGFLVSIRLDVLAHQNGVQAESLRESLSTQMLLTTSTSLIFVVITIATSLISFIVQYISHQPMAKRLIDQKQTLIDLEEELSEIRAEKSKYEIFANNYIEELEKQEYKRYVASSEIIKAMAEESRAYFRTELGKKLSDPVKISYISSEEEDYQKAEAKLLPFEPKHSNDKQNLTYKENTVVDLREVI